MPPTKNRNQITQKVSSSHNILQVPDATESHDNPEEKAGLYYYMIVVT